MKNATFRLTYNIVPHDSALCSWAEELLKQNGNKPVILEAMTESEAKSSRQNRTFYALLNCFYASGVHSFASLEEMRVYYKKIGGLVQVVRESLLPLGARNMLYKVAKILPLKEKTRRKFRTMLAGKKEVELSWSEVSKEKATLVIDCLIQDMHEAGVSGSKLGAKFEEILSGLEKNNQYQLAA
jgi:hypothetical protein